MVKLIDGRWHLWLCCHPLDLPEDTDRMYTRYGTSDDGLDLATAAWPWRGTPGVGPAGRPGGRRGRRDGRWLAYYDGRASKEENAEERTGLAVGDRPAT